jgi:hypothetical protein
MKICSVGIEFFHADMWTDVQTEKTMLIVALRNFENAPKIRDIYRLCFHSK